MRIEQLIFSLLSPSPIEIPSARTGAHSLALTPGQSMQAQVLSQLGDHRYQVAINQVHYDIKLPMPVQAGDKLQLRFLEFDAHRQPVFLLSSARTSVDARVTLTTQAQDWQKMLSDAAIPNKTLVASPLPLVTDMPKTPVAALAQSLMVAVRDSGLFYERHVAAWAQGGLPLTQLLREPQGRLSPLLAKNPERLLPTQMADDGPTAAKTSTPDVLVTEVDAEAPAKGQVLQRLPELVQQQLQGLEQRQMQWSGQIWPGQSMHWLVEEQSGDDTPDTEASERLWQSSLRLELPHLGHVEVQISLLGEQLYLRIQADAATQLAAQTSALRAGLEDAGLQLQAIRVNGEDAHGG